jgi:hypothetical protein
VTQEPIEFDPVDAIGAGAYGQPGERTFVIQARKGSAVLSVLVEKEQVALLASEAEQFLDRIAEEHPEEPGTFGELADSGVVEEDEPLFRARLIGIASTPNARWCCSSSANRPPTTTNRRPHPKKAKGTSRGSMRRVRRSAPCSPTAWSRLPRAGPSARSATFR